METTPRLNALQPVNRREFNAIVRLVKNGVIVNIGLWQCEQVSGDDTKWSYMVTAESGDAWWFPVAEEAVSVLCEQTDGVVLAAR